MKIDGKQLATALFAKLSENVASLKRQDITPHLVVILVGNDPASEAYVRQKKLKGESIEMKVTVRHFDKNVTSEELLATIQQYNNDSNVHGIVIQQPLPKHVDVPALIMATSPDKDVDGFHPQSRFTPPIAEAAIHILESVAKEKNEPDFASWFKKQHIIVVGKGETGGTPIIKACRELGVTPTIIDSKTKDPDALTRKTDIIVSCVGRSRMIRKENVKPGVILLSIGMFRGEDGRLHGDYEEDEVKDIAAFYTPVPGGVGPVNVAMLLQNVIASASIGGENVDG